MYVAVKDSLTSFCADVYTNIEFNIDSDIQFNVDLNTDIDIYLQKLKTNVCINRRFLSFSIFGRGAIAGT